MNIFLEVLLDQARAEECAQFLRSVQEGGEEASISDLALDSVLIVMEAHGQKPKELGKFIASLSTYRGLSLYWMSQVDRLEATDHMERHGLDYEDAAQYQVAKRIQAEAVVSLDRHFDPIPDLERLEPNQVS